MVRNGHNMKKLNPGPFDLNHVHPNTFYNNK